MLRKVGVVRTTACAAEVIHAGVSPSVRCFDHANRSPHLSMKLAVLILHHAVFGAWLRLLGLGLLLSAGVAAQPVHLLSSGLPTPVNGDGASGDNFGIAVASAGDVAVVGAYGDTQVAAGATFGVAQGAAYVFEKVDGNWLPLQKLVPQPIGASGDNYGVSVALVDDVIAIGAPRRDPDSRFEAGSVFIYGRSAEGYLLRQILTPAFPEAEQRFGAALALWQDYLAVGAPWADGGRVDLYRRDGGGNYALERSLFALPGDGNARFGAALAMANGDLLIGAPEAADGGAVYRSVHNGAGWSDAVRLSLAAVADEELGAALALDGDLALVGAPGSAAGTARILTLVQGQWSQTDVIDVAGGSPGDRFGSALVLDASRAAIAAVGALHSEGVVHVYDRAGAALVAASQLDIADGGLAKRFGVSLAFGSDGLLIGADLDRVGPNRGQGTARWFQRGANGYAQTAQLDSGDGAIYDRYGTAVAVDGDIALIGAYLEDTEDGADAGAAHWFERNAGEWQYGGQLRAPDAAIEDRFGIAVDVDSGRMAVGAFWDVIGNNVDQGSVYLYRREGSDWVFEQKLVASDGRQRDYFGFSLSLDGDRLLVGARGASVPALEQGVAYVFSRGAEGWQQQARLDLPFANGFAYFGASVALVGNLALIGAPGATVAAGPVNAGAAFVFVARDDSWSLLSTLQAPQPQANSAYGFAVAADPDHWLIGAFQEGFAGQGAAFVYRSSDAGLDGELRAAFAQPGEALGISVAVQGGTAVLGAPGYDLGQAFGVGSVRVFERGARSWAETEQWFAADGVGGDAFGRAVAFDGRHAVIGAPSRGVDNPLEGHAYVGTAGRLFADGFE